MATYRQNLPARITKKAENKGNFSQPPAKHNASPTTGNHEKKSAQSPLALTVTKAFCFSVDKSEASGYFFAANAPNPQVVMAPRVLPKVATVIRFSMR